MSRAQKGDKKTVSRKNILQKDKYISHYSSVMKKYIYKVKVLYRHVKMRLLRPRIFTGEFSWCLNMWIYSCLCGSSLFGFFGSLGGDIMGPYPRLRDPKALKPSAFRMISWAKSRFFCVISYRGQDRFCRFHTCKCTRGALVLSARGDTWGHVVGHVSREWISTYY